VADSQIGSIDLSLTFRNETQGTNAALVATPANYASIAALKARLTAISSTTWTTARMNQMTVNDLIYAVRLNDDPGTI
jgi:hypothetical protein